MLAFSPRAISYCTTIVVLAAAACLHADSKKQAEDQRIELLRGLSAEQATVRAYIPRSRRPLDIDSDGTYDQKAWEQMGREVGPAARLGDIVQVTKVRIDKDAITLELNNGAKGRLFDGAQINNQPIRNNGEQVLGSAIIVHFSGGIAGVTSADVKKLLKPVLDFTNGSVTEQYVEDLPPEIKQAVHDKKAIEGMNRDQVLLALGRPNHKVRETVDGVDTEDWIYGEPPGRMTFVTFAGQKVAKVKETYAGLGGSIAETPKLP
jgi:hypothetical protein